MISHETVAEYLQPKRVFPFLEVIQVILEVAVLNENGLLVMPALNDVVGQTGYNDPCLSGHLASPCRL